MSASYANRTVLVSGAAGFIGSHLVGALARAGAQVHGLRRSTSREPRVPVPAEVIWHAVDLVDAPRLQEVVERVQPTLVFHLAACGAADPAGDPEAMFDGNVRATWQLWKASEASHARFVMTGTCAEYGQLDRPSREDMRCLPLSPYAATKHAAVSLIAGLALAARREAVILRPYGIIGPGDQLDRVIPSVIAGLLRGGEVPVTEGKQLRDFADVDDHVRALMLAGSTPGLRPGAIYNIGSGYPMTLRQALQRVAATVKGPGHLVFGGRPYRRDEIWNMTADTSLARRELGFKAEVKFEAAVARTAAWLRTQMQADV